MAKRNSPGCSTNPCCGCTFTPKAYQCIGSAGVFAGNASPNVGVPGVAITLSQGGAAVASGTTDATGQAAISVAAGTYTMTGTDAYGNTASGSITLTCPNPGSFFVALPTTTGVTCCAQFCSGTPIPTTLHGTTNFGTFAATLTSGNWVGYQTVTVPGIDLNTCANVTVSTLVWISLQCDTGGASSFACPFRLNFGYEASSRCGGAAISKPIAYSGPATTSLPGGSGTSAAGAYTYGQAIGTYGSGITPTSKSPLALSFPARPTLAINLGIVTFSP